MNKTKILKSVHSFIQSFDWKLFLFLILFLNAKMAVKIAAIIFIYLLRFNFRFGFRLRSTRLPLFYVIIIAIAFLNWFLTGSYLNINQNVAFATGIFFWLLCILAIHQIRLSVDTEESAKIYNSILLFFILNSLFSLGNLLSIMWETGSLNPYQYQGLYQKYFIGTGDDIKGISFDVSTTNALINALGVVFFISRNKIFMSFLCMTVLLLTGSNFTNLLIICTLLYMLAFQSTRDQKSIIVLCLLALVIFVARVSPQNNEYVLSNYEKIFEKEYAVNNIAPAIPVTEKPDSLLTADEKKEKIAKLYLDSVGKARQLSNLIILLHARDSGKIININTTTKPIISEPDINGSFFQKKDENTAQREELIKYNNEEMDDLFNPRFYKPYQKLPGKFLGFIQTTHFLKKNPGKIIFGNGMGNFSSKLAFKTTALDISGKYPKKLAYVNSNFKNNHLALYLYYFSKGAYMHSIINSPNSVFDQLLSEYGIAGLLTFILFYIGFFIRGRKQFYLSIPQLMIIGGAFVVDYWFEQLSLVIVFELMLFLNLKDKRLSNHK